MVDVNTWICWSKDYDNLARSASGGVMYELAKHIISKGGFVVGVNQKGEFDIANTLEKVQSFQGSKYWKPTQLYVTVRQCTHIDKPILFVGSPCQIGYAKHILRNQDVYYICLQCHGHYNKKGVVREGTDKHNGWSKSWHHLPKDFLDNTGLADKCKECKLGGKGDLLISDAWDCPKHQINEYGTSRVKILTERGKELFDSVHGLEKDIEDTYQLLPRRVALIDVHDYTNLGNQLLAVNFINYMHKLDPEMEFVFLEERCSNAHKQIDPQVEAKVYYRTVNLTREPMSFIVKDGIGIETIADCQALIVLGGDCFSSNSWHWKWIRYFLFFYLCQKKNIKTFFVSNTIGNFPWYIKLIGHRILKKFTGLYVRDGWSMSQLLKIGVKNNVYHMPDLAFVDMPKWDTNIPNEKYIVLSPSLLWEKYCDTKENYIDLCKYIYALARKETQLPVYIMPHSTNLHAQRMALDIANSLNAPIYLPENSSDARQFLQHSEFNICFRMHSAMQSVQGGVKYMAIGYSEKYKEQLHSLRLSTPNHFHIVDVFRYSYNHDYVSLTKYFQVIIDNQLKSLLEKITGKVKEEIETSTHPELK